MKSLFALTGIFQPPLEEGGYTAVPMLSDVTSSSLFVFVMFPGAYADIYEIASKSKFANIFIVPISLNAQYITDVHRLVTDLTPLKSHVKVLYPGRYPLPVNSINELAIISGDSSKCTFTFPSGFIAFDKATSCGCGCSICGSSSTTQSSSHDILVRYDNVSYLLTSTKVSADRILSVLESGIADYVYVPYAYGYVNQDNFLTLMKDERLATYHDNIIAYGFRNYEEFKQCYLKYPMSAPMTYRYVFLEDGVATLYDKFSPVIGSIAFCPSIFYIDASDKCFPLIKDGEIIATEDTPEYLPTGSDDESFVIEENPDPEIYELKAVELEAGTNFIYRTEGIDIPFNIYFAARRRISFIDALTSQESHEPIDTVVSWKDIDVGIYNSDMKLISLKDLIGNQVLNSGDKAIITLFNNEKAELPESGKSEIVFTTDYVTAYYYDAIPVEEPEVPEDPEPDVPIEGEEVAPEEPTEEVTPPETEEDIPPESTDPIPEEPSTEEPTEENPEVPSDDNTNESESTPDTTVDDNSTSETETTTDTTDDATDDVNTESSVVDGPDGIDII